MYNAYAKEGWNDELLVGAEEGEPEKQVEALVKDSEGEKEKAERPMPRVTEADKTGDQRSLNRKLTNSLYLLVKGKSGWSFPSAELIRKENLHQVCTLSKPLWAFTDLNTGGRAYSCSGGWSKHEYLGCRPRPNRALLCQSRKPDHQHRYKYIGNRVQDLLHEGTYHGRSSQFDIQCLGPHRFQVAG